MRVRLRQLNEELLAAAANGVPSIGTIKMGVGINTGQCCVGNLGSEQRFNYSVLGDNVNLATRFEEETKSFGVDLVIGENTLRRVPDLEAYELGRTPWAVATSRCVYSTCRWTAHVIMGCQSSVRLYRRHIYLRPSLIPTIPPLMALTI